MAAGRGRILPELDSRLVLDWQCWPREPDPQELVAQVLETAGVEEKLLKLFRLRERLLVTKTPAEPVT